MKCNLECQKSISLDESAIPSDTGFFWKFQSDPETGIPSGCPGFPNNWPNGNKVSITPNCPIEDHAPEGEKLHSIVEDYADKPQKWFDDFVEVIEKMLSNGYSDELLINNFDILEK